MRRFDAAPWSASVKVASTLGTAVLLAIAFGLPRALHIGRVPPPGGVSTMLAVLPFIILGVAVLFVVKGYEWDGAVLCVQRLLWSTRVPIDGLERAWHDSTAMRGSIRIFGNGGLYSITGRYRNATLGGYRAFVTDAKRSVVLQSATQTVVVSPARPEEFLRALQSRFPAARISP